MKIIMMFLGISLSLMSLSCGPKSIPAEQSILPEVPGQSDKMIEKTSWQENWEKTLAQAKKERRVTVYTTINSEARETWAKQFKDKFGIDIEFVVGRGADVSEKLLTERKAGINSGDLFITGLTQLHLTLKPAGALEVFEKKLFLPDVVGPEAWYDGRLPWFSNERLIFVWRLYPTDNLWINTQLIQPGEVKSYKDLLKPQWNGKKFVMNDPTTGGAGSKWFEVFSREDLLGIDYMKSFAKQEPILMRDTRLAATWVAQGKYSLSIAIGLGDYVPFISAGAPVAPVETLEPPYLTSGHGNLSWIKGSPHPATAKLFTNWLLSKEGQEITLNAERMHSARDDINIEGIEAGAFRKKGVKYFNANTEEMYKNLEPLKQLAQDIFGPLAR